MPLRLGAEKETLRQTLDDSVWLPDNLSDSSNLRISKNRRRVYLQAIETKNRKKGLQT
jgi:hypothetical protein